MKDAFCSMGLLGLATTGSVSLTSTESTKVLADIIREQFPERVISPALAGGPSIIASDGRVVASFNDHSETTFADVERVFEKAEIAWDERV